MESIKLNVALFAASHGKELKFDLDATHPLEFTSGDKVSAASHCHTIMTSGTITSEDRVVITPVIDAADMIVRGDVRVYEAKSSNLAYCEIGSEDEAVIPAAFDGTALQIEADARLDGAVQIAPLLAWLMSSHSCCPEIGSLFKTIFALKAEKDIDERIVYAARHKLAQMCDAFYFGFAKEHKEVPVVEMSRETFAMAISSGELQPIELLEGVEMRHSPLIESDAIESPEAETVAVKKKPIIKRCIEGEFRRDWGIDQNYSHMIPHGILEWFVPTPEFERAINTLSKGLDRILERMKENPGASLEKLIGSIPLNFALYGPPGSGKTVMAQALAEALGLPLLIQAGFTAAVDETIFQYQTIPDEDGRIVSVPSTFLQGFQMPCIILAEEINLLKPDVAMGALGEAIWAPYQMSLYGHKPVSRHPLSVFMFTQNIGTYGSKDVNQALVDRIKAGYRIAAPTKSQVIKVLLNHTKNKKLCEWVYKAYTAVSAFLDDKDATEVKLACSLNRTCGSLLEEIADGIPPKVALEDVLVSRIELADRTGLLGKEVVDNVIKKTIVDYAGAI